MIVYLVQRIGAALVVAWLAVSLAFVALRLAPGDALDATMARGGVDPSAIQAERARLGLDDPLWQQYAAYLGRLARGDLGESLVSQQPVAEMIAQNAGPTLALALGALLVAVALGVGLGVLASAAPWGGGRAAADAVIALMLSTPAYWTATLAIYLLTVAVPVFPGVGGMGPQAVILPVLVLGFHTAGGIARVTAENVRAEIGQDFIRTARAKGLPEADVLDHTLRVALLPVVAVIALQLGFLLGGTVITETIFVRRGLGRVLLLAVDNRDYPVIQGLVIVSALVYTGLNAAADVVFRLADPRVRIER
ncbi:ABC transporter permease [Aggregatilinea lenta]|uniref:ABC transporter permease n=1 Tax=Aggregatilinea lenta TaxID=913108 RepID=UPI000E5BB741|nr:ABC transporter permease [Aggregatilinea lenta]